MRQTAFIFCLCLALLAGAATLSAGPAAAARAPSFQLTTLDGQQKSLKGLTEDRHLLLVFWTTWCPSCRQTMPEVDQLASDYSRSDLAVFGVNAGWNDSLQRAKRFRDKHDLGFPIAFDSSSRVSKKYGLRGVPTLLLIDPQGEIRFEGYGVTIELLELLQDIESD